MTLSELEPARLSAGVDIGGSKVLAVALDESREVLAQVRLRTGTGADGVVESAVEAVHRLATQAGVRPEDFCVVGVGVPGPVGPGSGDVSHAVNLGVGDGVLALGPLLAARLGVPVMVETVVLGGGVTEVGPALLHAVTDALTRRAAGSPFLAALDLPQRVAVVPVGSAVVAIGAALSGVVAYDVGRQPA